MGIYEGVGKESLVSGGLDELEQEAPGHMISRRFATKIAP
jgi:hypothetical protein